MQNEDGSMPSGRNGPWNHEQTPVRNTSHWSIIFAYAYKITLDKEFLVSSEKCINYLLQNHVRPNNKSFKHRKGDGINKCNGLIGQAWTIEGLTVGGELIKVDQAQEIAREVFHLHPFVSQRGLWKPVEIDGTTLPIHGVINQQIWFAAVGSIISSQGDQRASEKVSIFLDQLDKNLDVYSTGLIRHTGCQHANRIKRKIWRVATQDAKTSRILSEGYHSFNLYGLSILRQNYPNHDFWESDKYRSIIEYTRSIQYKQAVAQNLFAYGYNPTGFEIVFYIKSTPECTQEKSDYWLQEQINRSFDKQEKLMKIGSDPETLLARTYEVVRLLDKGEQ